ncbi:MAG: restriction endonuclease, partial [Chloroflexi bacterium]|nr:restriction endonuclease [Chloroflexota bacterium]
MAEEWDISPGTTLLRSELHDRWGGARFGGIEPAPRAESVFLFYKPDVRSAFGYDYDGAQPDGTFHYTGDGQVGDQLPTVGGNKSLLDAPRRGRTIRLFRAAGTMVTYEGAFKLIGQPPYFQAEAKDGKRELRS